MKSRLLIAAASAALMAVPSIASAQFSSGVDDTEGWYLRGQAGYGVHTDIELEGDVVSDVMVMVFKVKVMLQDH